MSWVENPNYQSGRGLICSEALLVFENRATAKCVAHHPVKSRDEHRR